jgi:hypothetical protein
MNMHVFFTLLLIGDWGLGTGEKQGSREQGAGSREQGEIICIFPISNYQLPATSRSCIIGINILFLSL